MRSEHTSDPVFRETFTLLVETARDQHSTYVAPVLDAGLQRATLWVAVARPAGPTLAELVNGLGPLPVEALRPLALALAQGLADLHATGRAHGSLRPDGVLVSPHCALIADPGFERAVTEPEYSAPPVFAPPEGGPSPAADVFAWAATLCFAASGVEGPRGLDRVPFQFRGLVDACLKIDPNLRPAATDLVHMLGGPYAPDPWPPAVREVATRSEETMRRLLYVAPPAAASPAPRRRRTVALVAGGAALTLVAAGAVWALGPRAAPGTADPDADRAATGLITEAGCLEGTGFPDPPGEIDDLDAMDVAFSPDGDLLAVTSNTHGLTLWDWREGVEIARPTEHVYKTGDPVFAPVGCMVAVVLPKEVESRASDIGSVSTYDIPSGETVERPEPPTPAGESEYSGRTARFSPDGTRLAIARGGNISLIGDEATVGLVDLSTNEITGAWGTEPVTDAGFTDDGRFLTLGPAGVTVWDSGTGEALHTERRSSSTFLAAVPGHDQYVHVDRGVVTWWDFGRRAVVGSFELTSYIGTANTYLTHVTLDPERERVHVGWAIRHPDEDVWNDPEISDRKSTNHGHLWDLETGEDLMADEGEHHLARPLALHPDGGVIAAIDQDGSVNLVDADTLEILHPLL
ncbi:protein kinase family protein [Nocardiopsis sp. NPDC007018]|uniref:protein kinase family protein n=1 Tax=Nocardiopsis sp. NPDC007018 TaxID=3155721 RepID=UPI0033F1F074